MPILPPRYEQDGVSRPRGELPKGEMMTKVEFKAYARRALEAYWGDRLESAEKFFGNLRAEYRLPDGSLREPDRQRLESLRAERAINDAALKWLEEL